MLISVSPGKVDLYGLVSIRSNCLHVWTMSTGGGCPYRRGRVSGEEGSAAPRRRTGRAGSRRRSRIRAPGSRTRWEAEIRVSTASVCLPPRASHHAAAPSGPPPRSSLHPPVPQVVLAVAAGEMGGAHAEAAQHTGAAVHAATRGRECT